MQASTFSPIAEARSAPAPSVDMTPKPAAVPPEEKKTRRSSIDWRGGFASLFGGSSPAPSPTTASPPTVAAPPLSSKLRPLSLSASPAQSSPPRVGVGAVSTPTPTAYRPEPQRRKSNLSSSGFSYRSSGSPAPLGTPPVRPEPIDSLVSYFGGGETAFPTALNAAGLGVNERVTVRRSLVLALAAWARPDDGVPPFPDTGLCRTRLSLPVYARSTRTSSARRPRSRRARRAASRPRADEHPSAVGGPASARTGVQARQASAALTSASGCVPSAAGHRRSACAPVTD